jgi:2-C-methyl-D-erythritol 4-phosphate cytidylyltransferase
MPRVWSIVVAAGTGSRFGGKKQFLTLAGRPVLEWAVEACRAGSTGVILVVPAESNTGSTNATTDTGSTAECSPGATGSGVARHGADVVVTGGASRDESVRCGLGCVPADADVIVVHDAARPLATTALFDAVVGALDDPEVDGAVPGSAPGDTIKLVDETGTVTRTFDRATLRAVQTPQAFRAGILREAHERGVAGVAGATDDAMRVEAIGGCVRVVAGEPDNIKITAPGDLSAAERVLAERRR